MDYIIFWHPRRGLVSGIVVRELPTELLVDGGEGDGFYLFPRPPAFVRVSVLSAGGSLFDPPPYFLALPVPAGSVPPPVPDPYAEGYAAGLAEGERRAVAAVVAWLHSQVSQRVGADDLAYDHAASAIAAGKHRAGGAP